jgi:hypothetical protein
MGMRFLACALALALAACGGDDGGSRLVYDDTVPTVDIPAQGQAQPITRAFSKAGTYTLTLTGAFQAVQAGGGPLDAWFSFSGQGLVTSGNAEPSYPLGAAGQLVNINESVTIQLVGDGPWQVTILCGANGSTGTLTGLHLHTAEH